MKNNSIVIMNIVGFPKIVSIESYNDESVKEALSKEFRIDVNNLERLTGDDNPNMIYGVKELYPQLERTLTSVNIYFSEHPAKHSHYIRVMYAIF